jgi:WD40 repeat protein
MQTNDKADRKSLVPIESSLIQVGKSLAISNKILLEAAEKGLNTINFKGNLVYEKKINGNIRFISSNNQRNLVIGTSLESSITEFNIENKTLINQQIFNGELGCFKFSSKFNAFTSVLGRVIYIYQNDEISQKLEGHNREINVLCLSNNGRYLFSGSGDKTIRVWDTTSWKCVKILEGHKWLVNSLITDSKDKYLYSGGWDSDIIKWDIESFEEVGKFNSGSAGGIKCLTITKDDNLLISGAGDGQIRLYKTNDNNIFKTLKGHTDFVSSLDVSTNNKIFASGGWDGNILVWDIENQCLNKTIKGHSDKIESVFFSKKYLATGGNDKTIKLWT